MARRKGGRIPRPSKGNGKTTVVNMRSIPTVPRSIRK